MKDFYVRGPSFELNIVRYDPLQIVFKALRDKEKGVQVI